MNIKNKCTYKCTYKKKKIHIETQNTQTNKKLNPIHGPNELATNMTTYAKQMRGHEVKIENVMKTITTRS